MVTLKHLVSFACVLLVAGFAVAQDGAPFVYVTTIDDGLSRILKISTDGQSEQCIYEESDSYYEDIVLGPDGLLYACDPSNGVIIRFDPNQIPDQDLGKNGSFCNLGAWGAEIIYEFQEPDEPSPGGKTLTEFDADENPLYPQCGWFTHKGGLLVNDIGGEGLGRGSFLCRNVASEPFNPDSAIPYCNDNLEELGDADFSGEGLTQTAKGNLLAVDAGWYDSSESIENTLEGALGQVWNLPMDMVTGEFTGSANVIVDGLEESLGVARLSTGDIVVTDFVSQLSDSIENSPGEVGGVLHRFSGTGGTASPSSACIDFGGAFPRFIEASADDTVYAITIGGFEDGPSTPQKTEAYYDFGATLWEANLSDCYCFGEGENDGDACIAIPIYYFDVPAIGIALPPTVTVGKIWPDPDPDPGEITFTQFDNALNVVAGDGCQAGLKVYEALRADVEALVDLLPDDAPEVMTDTFLGDNARYQVFDISPTNANCEDTADLIQFTISSFFQYDPLNSGTALILHCTEIDGDGLDCVNPQDDPYLSGRYWNWSCPLACDLIPLSNFSLSGIIPEDGRRTGKTPAFSLLVAAEQRKKLPGEDGAGDYCGLKPPVKNNAFFGTPVPPDGDFDEGDFPTFKMGRTLPLKFNVVDYSDMSKKKKPKEPSCKKGPYLTDLTIALSITRIAKPEGEDWVVTSDMVDPIPSGKGYIDEYGRAIFGQSGSKYHFNWRLVDLEGPGIYEIFIIPDDANFTPAIEYVRIK